MEHTPEIVVATDPADEGLGLPGRITARSADGLDAVEISFRFDGSHGPKRSLALLARACLEVLVRARALDGAYPAARVTEVPGLPGDPPAYLVEPARECAGMGCGALSACSPECEDEFRRSRESEGSRWNG